MEYNIQFNDSEVTAHLQGSSKGYIISSPVLFSNNKMLFSVLVPIRLFLVAHLGTDIYTKENKRRKWIAAEYFDGIYN
jgi:hypothetical protein